MSIKLEFYRVFKEVADAGSVSAAAKNLHISQSAVSQTLKHLESQLGVRLFTRGARGVTLTSEGKTLYDYVHNAIALIASGEEKIAMTKSLEIGELIIGASDTITRCFLLPYLEQFHLNYPNIKLRVLNGTSLEVAALLKAGKVDVGFVNFPLEEEGLDCRRCFGIQDIFVAAPDYPIDLNYLYSPEDLSHLPLILLERKANSRLYIESYFLQHGVLCTPEIELGSHDLLLSLARIGLGVSCVIREFARQQLSDGLIRELKVTPPVPPRSVAVCTLKNVTLAPACSRFLELVSDEQ